MLAVKWRYHSNVLLRSVLLTIQPKVKDKKTSNARDSNGTRSDGGALLWWTVSRLVGIRIPQDCPRSHDELFKLIGTILKVTVCSRIGHPLFAVEKLL